MMRPRIVALAAAALALACGPAPAPATDYRGLSDHFAFRVSVEPMPPLAREKALYRVVVRDRESNQPVEQGEGQIFATSLDRVNTWDALTQGPELGTYYANLRFLTAGQWAVAIRFRPDSTKPLERIDWTQEVLAERVGAP